jgi:hypothetical protein
MATVIDALVVTLGLDASKYKQGRETAQKETQETARVAKQAADQITKSLTEVGRTIAGLFLGFESASGFVKFLGNLNSGEAALGRTAKAIGMSAHELNKWGNAVDMAGGSAEDAQAAFRKLTEDVVTFQTTGKRSDLLNFLYARGVNPIDAATGKLRNQGEVFEELADKTAQYGAAYQATMFRQAGLNEGEINYLVQSKALRQQELADAEKRNGVTEDSIAKAQELQRYWRGIGQSIAEAGQKILLELTPYIKGAFQWTQDLYEKFKDTGGLQATADTFALIANTVKTIYSGWSQLDDLFQSSAIGRFFVAYNKGAFNLYKKAVGIGADPAAAENAGSAIADVFASRNNNPGNIKALPGQPADSRGFRIFGSEEEGLHAIGAWIQRHRKKGTNTISGLVNEYEGKDAPGNHNNIPAYIKTLMSYVGKGSDEQLSDSDLAGLISGIIAQEGNTRRVQSGATPGLTGRTGGSAQGGGSSTNVSVQTINVNAPNADPTAVAAAIPAAIQRKFSTTQADGAQN